MWRAWPPLTRTSSACRAVALDTACASASRLAEGSSQCRLACADQVLELRCLQVGESDRGRPVVADGLVAWLPGGVSECAPAFDHAGAGAVADGVEVPFPVISAI